MIQPRKILTQAMVQRSECRHQLQYPPDRHSLPYSSYVDPLLYPPPCKCKWHKQEASMQAHLWLRDIGNSTMKVAILVAMMVAETEVVAMQGFVGHV